MNNQSFTIDNYAIVANPDATLVVTTNDKSSEKPKNREVRLLVEVKQTCIRCTV